MSSPSFRALLSMPLLSLVSLVASPADAAAQYSTWSGQAELFAGRFAPHGERTGLSGPLSSMAPVVMKNSLLVGGRLFFPVADTHRHHLGKLSLGLRGIVVSGAELKAVGYLGGVGTADHFELLGTVSTGDFLPVGGGLNLRLNGTAGVGIGHTSYSLDPGFLWEEGETSVTVPVVALGLGVDIPVTHWLSLMTSASVSWSLTKPDEGTATERSFALAGGLALRWPFDRD